MGNRLGVDASGSIVRVAASLSRGRFGDDSRTENCLVEDTLLNFLKQASVWGAPWIFDSPATANSDDRHGRVFCFLLDTQVSCSFLPLVILHAKPCSHTLHCVTHKRMDTILQAIQSMYELCKPLMDNSSNRRVVFPIFVTGSGADELNRLTQAELSVFNSSLIKAESTHLLHIDFKRVREVDSVLNALDYLVRVAPTTLFHYEKTHQGLTDAGPLPPATTFRSVALNPSVEYDMYPYLLVNLKAGVSFHKVTSRNSSVRVGGSPIGCSTFVGLVKLLCGRATTPFDAFLFAQRGNLSTVDMLVQDIYGGDYESIGLKGSIVASTLGKMQAISMPGSSVSDSSSTSATSKRKNLVGGRASIILQEPRLRQFGSHLVLKSRDRHSSTSEFDDEDEVDHDPFNTPDKPQFTIVQGLRCRDVLGEDAERVGGFDFSAPQLPGASVISLDANTGRESDHSLFDSSEEHAYSEYNSDNQVVYSQQSRHNSHYAAIGG